MTVAPPTLIQGKTSSEGAAQEHEEEGVAGMALRCSWMPVSFSGHTTGLGVRLDLEGGIAAAQGGVRDLHLVVCNPGEGTSTDLRGSETARGWWKQASDSLLDPHGSKVSLRCTKIYG